MRDGCRLAAAARMPNGLSARIDSNARDGQFVRTRPPLPTAAHAPAHAPARGPHVHAGLRACTVLEISHTPLHPPAHPCRPSHLHSPAGPRACIGHRNVDFLIAAGVPVIPYLASNALRKA